MLRPKIIRILFCIFGLVYSAWMPGIGQSDTAHRIWVGVDILPFAKVIYGSNENSMELFFSYAVRKNKFLVAESGLSKADYKGSNFTYFSEGWFVRGGLDFNLLRDDKFRGNDHVLLGLRYGFSSMKYRVNDIHIYSPYWPSYLTSLPFTTFGNHWFEAKAGVRAEVMPHFSIGWAIAGRVLLYSGHRKGTEPYVIPGFGNGLRKANAGFSYYIFLSF